MADVENSAAAEQAPHDAASAVEPEAAAAEPVEAVAVEAAPVVDAPKGKKGKSAPAAYTVRRRIYYMPLDLSYQGGAGPVVFPPEVPQESIDFWLAEDAIVPAGE